MHFHASSPSSFAVLATPLFRLALAQIKLQWGSGSDWGKSGERHNGRRRGHQNDRVRRRETGGKGHRQRRLITNWCSTHVTQKLKLMSINSFENSGKQWTATRSRCWKTLGFLCQDFEKRRTRQGRARQWYIRSDLMPSLTMLILMLASDRYQQTEACEAFQHATPGACHQPYHECSRPSERRGQMTATLVIGLWSIAMDGISQLG